jgi:hypothetical protein
MQVRASHLIQVNQNIDTLIRSLTALLRAVCAMKGFEHKDQSLQYQTLSNLHSYRYGD